jgi:hypothetical protein
MSLKENSVCWSNPRGESRHWYLIKYENAIIVNEENEQVEFRICEPEKGVGFQACTDLKEDNKDELISALV